MGKVYTPTVDHAAQTQPVQLRPHPWAERLAHMVARKGLGFDQNDIVPQARQPDRHGHARGTAARYQYLGGQWHVSGMTGEQAGSLL
jgi:hypothetical protein